MPKDYYQNILYPLQDNILRHLENIDTSFYLTGGTALSRAYLQHRYSDNLDFFANNNDLFKEEVQKIIDFLKAQGYTIEIPTTDVSFVRLFVNTKQAVLKIDFVNDVSFRKGIPVKTTLFYKTDIVENILSNKLTALSRFASKDIADIVFICLNYKFEWEKIIADAAQKDMWINPIESVKILESFPLDNLHEINWVVSPDIKKFRFQLNTIIRDILEGKENTLYV